MQFLNNQENEQMLDDNIDSHKELNMNRDEFGSFKDNEDKGDKGGQFFNSDFLEGIED